jgi:hypothetical protein
LSRTNLVVAVARLNLPEIDLVIEQMMNGEFESTGNELTGKIYRDKARTVMECASSFW